MFKMLYIKLVGFNRLPSIYYVIRQHCNECAMYSYKTRRYNASKLWGTKEDVDAASEMYVAIGGYFIIEPHQDKWAGKGVDRTHTRSRFTTQTRSCTYVHVHVHKNCRKCWTTTPQYDDQRVFSYTPFWKQFMVLRINERHSLAPLYPHLLSSHRRLL